MTADTITPARPIAGMISFALGAVALLMAMVQFWNGPLSSVETNQKNVSVSVGEMAAEMRQAAVRKLKGQPAPQQQPAPPADQPWKVPKIFKLLTSILAGIALVAAATGFVRRETWRPVVVGTAFGSAALLFQLFAWFSWIVLLVVGAIMLVAIISNVDGIIGT